MPSRDEAPAPLHVFVRDQAGFMSDESKRCALCGAQNECGVAAGASHCWCFDVVIPASLLARIPEELRDRACVCPSCIEREKAGGLPLL